MGIIFLVIWIILKVIIGATIIRAVLGKVSNIMLFSDKMAYWPILSFIISLLFWVIFSNIQDSFDATFYGWLFALLILWNHRKKLESIYFDAEGDSSENEDNTWLRKSFKKYKIGLITYIIAGLIGWVWMYAELVQA